MYKALISFCGVVTMRKGEVKDIENADIAKDLLRAGYIEEVKTTPAPKQQEKKKK